MTDPEKTVFRAALASDPKRMAEACWVIARANVRERGPKPQNPSKFRQE